GGGVVARDEDGCAVESGSLRVPAPAPPRFQLRAQDAIHVGRAVHSLSQRRQYARGGDEFPELFQDTRLVFARGLAKISQPLREGFSLLPPVQVGRVGVCVQGRGKFFPAFPWIDAYPVRVG